MEPKRYSVMSLAGLDVVRGLGPPRAYTRMVGELNTKVRVTYSEGSSASVCAFALFSLMKVSA